RRGAGRILALLPPRDSAQDEPAVTQPARKRTFVEPTSDACRASATRRHFSARNSGPKLNRPETMYRPFSGWRVEWNETHREGSPVMAEKFAGEQRWPGRCAKLDETQGQAGGQSLASAWHEGWVPNREDVENLTDEARGAIDAAEYRRRAHAAARRHAAVAGR